MLGLTSSYPRQNLYIIELTEDTRTLNIRNHFWTDTGIVLSNNATITYNGSDQYVWEIQSGNVDPASGESPVSFIDTVTRVAD